MTAPFLTTLDAFGVLSPFIISDCAICVLLITNEQSRPLHAIYTVTSFLSYQRDR